MRELFASLTDADGALPVGAVLSSKPIAEGTATRLGAMCRGARGVIVGIAVRPGRAHVIDAHELERRLLEMGFVEGAHVEVLHEGPIGRDPIAVRLDDTRVALRRGDADAIIVAAGKDARAE